MKYYEPLFGLTSMGVLVFVATIEIPLMVLEATLVEINLGVLATAGGKMNAPTGVAEAVVNCDSLITNG